MPKINNHLVIMAGGVGSRFWPMSTAENPKQFIDVLGCGKTLLQLTVERFGDLVAPENIWVVTNEKYAGIVAQQLPSMPRTNILCEPCRRNTAPCIAYVSWRIKKKDPKANIVVTPSDHIVMNVPEFQRVISECMKFTSDTDAIVTLGMKPSRPETGYGYIQANLAAPSLRNKGIFRVDSFREKPDLSTAQQYIQQNNYFWNAGIFIWNVNTIVNAFRMYQPKLAKIFENMLPIYGTPEEQADRILAGMTSNQKIAQIMVAAMPASGAAIPTRCAISPGWFVPISTTRKSASGGHSRIVIGSPRSLL